MRLTRPDQVALIVVVFMVGGLMGRATAVADGSGWGGWLVAAAAVVAIAVSVHAANEYADADTDARTSRTRFSGGSGVIPSGLVTRAGARRLMVGAGALGVVLAGLSAWAGVVPTSAAIAIVLGLILGWQYSVPPLALARRRWGEVTNALLGGLLLPATGAIVMGSEIGPALIAFVPFTLLAFVNLLETQWSDRRADRAVGKHTLANGLSLRALRRLAMGVTLASYVGLLLLPVPIALAGLLALPFSVWATIAMGRRPPGPAVAAMVVAIVAQGVGWAVVG